MGETGDRCIMCQELTNALKKVIRQHEDNKSNEAGRAAILQTLIREDLSDKVPLTKDPNEAGSESPGCLEKVSHKRNSMGKEPEEGVCLEYSTNFR